MRCRNEAKLQFIGRGDLSLQHLGSQLPPELGALCDHGASLLMSASYCLEVFPCRLQSRAFGKIQLVAFALVVPPVWMPLRVQVRLLSGSSLQSKHSSGTSQCSTSGSMNTTTTPLDKTKQAVIGHPMLHQCVVEAQPLVPRYSIKCSEKRGKPSQCAGEL